MVKTDACALVDALDAVPKVDICDCGRPRSEHTFWDDKVYDVQGRTCPGTGTFNKEYRFSPTQTAARHRDARAAVVQQANEALEQRLADVAQEREKGCEKCERWERARISAYRQARVFEPSFEGYNAAMSVYAAAFGKPDGELGVIIHGERKEAWELAPPQSTAASAEALDQRLARVEGLVEQWRTDTFVVSLSSQRSTLTKCADDLTKALKETP